MPSTKVQKIEPILYESSENSGIQKSLFDRNQARLIWFEARSELIRRENCVSAIGLDLLNRDSFSGRLQR